MKIKSFWNREPKTLSPTQLAIERQLVPRLKLMGFIFLFLSLASLGFIFFSTKATQKILSPLREEIEQIAFGEADLFDKEDLPDELELEPMEVLNFYVVSFIFASLGVKCLWVSKRKEQSLFQEDPIIKEEEVSSADS